MNGLRGNSVNDNYLDGISITRSGSHVWSFVAGVCTTCNNTPQFLGNDWTCAGTGCVHDIFVPAVFGIQALVEW